MQSATGATVMGNVTLVSDVTRAETGASDPWALISRRITDGIEAVSPIMLAAC